MTTVAPASEPTSGPDAPPNATAPSEAPPPSRSPPPRPSSPSPPPPPHARAPNAGPGPGDRVPRQASRPRPSDPLSDKATSFLIRKVLCPQQLADKGRATPAAPIEELLPPLTSRNDVDLQLYAIIAIVLREFVQNWYNKITPDETFVAEIIQVIAHCTRALEQRLRKVDLESLLFDELPELLDRHVQGKSQLLRRLSRASHYPLLTARPLAYRVAHDPMARPPLEVDPRKAYHALCPLPALSPVPAPDDPLAVADQADNEVAYRQLLVRGVLAVLLPTEDLENQCLTALVGQIFSELIIGGVIARKASEPWMIWEGLIILTRVIRQKTTTESTPAGDSQGTDRKLSTGHQRHGFSVHGLLSVLLHVAFAAFAFLRFAVATIAASRALPLRRDGMIHHKEGYEPLGPPPTHTTSAEPPPKTPVVAFKLWPALSNLIEMNSRMPWACGVLSMLQWIAMTGPGQVAGTDGVVDRWDHPIFPLPPSQIPPAHSACRLSHWTAADTSQLRDPGGGVLQVHAGQIQAAPHGVKTRGGEAGKAPM